MKFKYILVVFSVVFLSDVVFADGENDIKGMFPYMAFIYYSDESIVDSTGNRFLRGGVLILKDWLVTSAVQISDNANDVAFPRKTLLARLGAVAIDSKFTLNEDEDEQEREIIQIVRPYNHSATQWWRTDITLMQTLLPFNLTSAVNLAPASYQMRSDKPCFILAYAKRFGNSTEERVLVQSSVDLLPPSITNCGTHYFADTMTCANDAEDNKNDFHDPTVFCQGNSGGPLVCDSLVVGLQTYIDNNCKAPHLYQLLAPWTQLINCATKKKCDQIECTDFCTITNKDAPLTLESTLTYNTHETTLSQETTTMPFNSETNFETSDVTTEPPILQTHTTMKEITEGTHEAIITEISITTTILEESELPQPVVLISAPPALLPAQLPAQTPPQSPQSPESPAELPVHLVAQSPTQLPPQSTQAPSQPLAEYPTQAQQQSWPKEKEDSLKKVHEEDCEDEKRRTNVEAQQDSRAMTQTNVKHAKKRVRSAAERNMCIFQSLFCIFILAGFF